MYIAELELTNLRSFRGTQKISLDRGDGSYAGWTVFAGRNGSGKSTLLKAIGAAVVGPLALRALAGGVPNWIHKDEREAQVRAHLNGDDYYDIFDDYKQHYPSLQVGLQWSLKGNSTLLSPALGKGSARTKGPWSENPLGWFIAGYGPYRRLGPATTEIAKVSADANLSRLINLYSEAATLTDAVDWLKTVHLRELEKKPGAKRLREDVLRLLADGLLPDGSKVEKVDSEGLWITRDGVTLPLEQVSDGYRTVTALVVDIARRLHSAYDGRALSASGNRQHLGLELSTRGGSLHCPLPGVVLIDEVDTHMHVEWQQKIGFWLTRHFPKIQFLTTSHSPFVCQAASPRGIIRLPAPGEPRTMEHLEPRLFNAVVNGGADDAVMSELFGLEHAHSAAAELLRARVAALELKLLTKKATAADKREYKKLRSELPSDLGEDADLKLRAVRGAEKVR